MADQTSERAKQTKKTVDELPTKTQIAAGFAGTAADIASAGTYSTAFKGVKAGKVIKAGEAATMVEKGDKAVEAARATKAASGGSIINKVRKTKDVVTDIAPVVASNAASGGFNAVAAGGDKKDFVKNAALGGMFPIGLKVGGELTGKALDTIMSKVKAPKSLLENAKTQALLKKAADDEAVKTAEKLPRLINRLS
jgi:hypothetical protein